MFAYFLDDWTAHKRYAKEVDKLDLMLTQHGIIGRRIRLGRLHDLDASVADCAESGVKTFVAVGNDATASKLVNCLLKTDWYKNQGPKAVALAVLPVGEGQKVAASLGAATITDAVMSLVAHRAVSIDVGKLNDRHYFVTAATFPPKVSLEFSSYTVSLMDDEHQVHVCNTNMFSLKSSPRFQAGFNPQDGVLEAVITRRLGSSAWSRPLKKGDNFYQIESVFPHKKITVLSREKTVSVIADAEKQLSTPVTIEIEPARLLVIAGVKKNF